MNKNDNMRIPPWLQCHKCNKYVFNKINNELSEGDYFDGWFYCDKCLKEVRKK